MQPRLNGIVVLAEKPKDNGLDQISQEKNSDFTYNRRHHDCSDRRLDKLVNLPNIVNNAQKDDLCWELHLLENLGYRYNTGEITEYYL